MPTKWQVPSTMPGGELMPHMSGRFRQTAMDVVFYNTGGIERLSAWANTNDENYHNFIKLWAKGAIRATQIENIAPPTAVEDLLARLDAGEHAKVVSGDGENEDV